MAKLFISVDIGNSYTSIATFLNDKLAKYDSFVTSDDIELEVAKFFKDFDKERYEISGLISSVVPKYTFYVARAILEKTNVLLRVINDGFIYDIPKTVEVRVTEIGGDLIAGIVGAKEEYGYPCIVVDVGTVTKVLVVDEKGKFVGATFAPGLHLSLTSMASGTALLRNGEEKFTKEPIGKNTFGCMLSGVTNQIVSGIKETVRPYEKEGYKVVLTGGYAKALQSYLPRSYKLDEYLIVKGIKYMYESEK